MDTITVYYQGHETKWKSIELFTESLDNPPQNKFPYKDIMKLFTKSMIEEFMKTEANRIKKRCRKIYNKFKIDMKEYLPNICQLCGKTGKVHGHHQDYEKPIESLMWLCSQCHMGIHKGKSYKYFIPNLIFNKTATENAVRLEDLL